MMQQSFDKLTLGGAPLHPIRGSSGGETSLKMKNSKLISLKMPVRENIVTFVIQSLEQVGSQINTLVENTY